MEFSELLSQIKVRHLSVEIKLKHPLNAPGFWGSTIHGSAGWPLKQLAPELWALAYGDSQVKYMRFANLPETTARLDAGSRLCFDWWLYGPLAERSDYLLPMFILWGKQGLKGSEFELVKLQQVNPLGQKTGLFIAPSGQYATPIGLPPESLLERIEAVTEHFDNMVSHSPDRLSCMITANSSIMIKHQQQICRQPVALDIWLTNIARRLISLGKIISKTAVPVHDFLPQIAAELISDQTRFATHIRKKPGQHHQTMGGITGYWVYQGELQAALPWLSLGQWLGIGNKTSFGFGDYSWQILSG